MKLSLSARCVGDLVSAVRSGERPGYFFFWRHHREQGQPVGEECLSQWYASPFDLEGVHYPTAEHYMMAEKARLFGDLETRSAVLNATTPRDAKALGRSVSSFDEDVWMRERFGIVVRATIGKFGQEPELRDYLLGTRGRILVEASPYDRVWGIGLTQDDPCACDPCQWRGENLLGFALMEAREQLAQTE